MTIYTQRLKNQLVEYSGGLADSVTRPHGHQNSAGDSLPCLYSNNSIETPTEDKTGHPLSAVQAVCDLLSPYHKRAAHTLYSNVDRLISLAPSINHVGFLTLTFADNVTDHEEAYKRFRSFNTNYLSNSENFGEWIAVKERQRRGAWHYHLIVILKSDIRTGVDFGQFSENNYKSANDYLRYLWQELRENLPKYNLGRSELLPIRTNAEGMARYIGKYISKHMGTRAEDDKGVRLVNYSRNWTKNSVRFAWFTDNSKLWRKKVALFAEYHGCEEIYQLSDKLGSDWAYRFAEDIYNIEEILEENGGLVAPKYTNTTIQRSGKSRSGRAKEKQTAKEKCRFREYENELKYKARKRLVGYEQKNIVHHAIEEHRYFIELDKKQEVPF